jgi:hypothetical protein
MPKAKQIIDEITGEVLQTIKCTKYEPYMCQKIIEVAEQGGHVASMCMAIGVRSKDTFYRWLKEYPEFNDAYEASKLVSQAFYENLLLAGAVGKIKNYNFNSLAMVMNNKFPDEYKRSATGSSGTEINIGSINSIEQLDSASLDKKIESLQKKLNMIPSPSFVNSSSDISLEQDEMDE